MATYTTFEQLECWQLCRKLVRFVQVIVKALPAHEKYELISNITRAARSTTRNIAEGFGRYYFKDRIKFCRVSKGSLYEVKDDLITCLDENYIDQEKYQFGNELVDAAIYSVNGYIKYLKQRDSEDQEH